MDQKFNILLTLFCFITISLSNHTHGSQIVGYCRLSGNSTGEIFGPGDTTQYQALPFLPAANESWTLDKMFPNGAGIEARSENVLGTEVLVLQELASGELDVNGASSFYFDGSNWVSNSGAAAGSEVISSSSRILLRQDSSSIITPIISGVYTDEEIPVYGAISYLNSAPTVVSVTERQDGTVLISWLEAHGATSYEIYRSVNGGDVQLVGLASSTATSFIDSVITNGTYTYSIRALNSGGSFVQSTNSISVEYRGSSSDFDDDGVDDFIWQNVSSRSAAFWFMERNQGRVRSGGFFDFLVPVGWKIVNHSDFTSDGRPDFLLRHSSGITVVWEVEDGRLVLEGSSRLNISPPSAWRVAGVDQFVSPDEFPENLTNVDNADIAWQHSGGLIVYWSLGGLSVDTGSYEVGGGAVFPNQVGDVSWQLVAVADFDNDGNSDLFWQNSASGRLVIWFLNEDKSIKSSGSLSIQHNSTFWRVVGVGDWNGDGKKDIIHQHQNGRTVIWLLDGLTFVGGFATSAQVGSSWQVRNSRGLE